MQRLAFENLQRLDAIDGGGSRVHHDHLPHRCVAGIAPAVLCPVPDFIRAGHGGVHVAAHFHRCRQVSLHAIRCRRARFLVAAPRLELHRRLAFQCNHWAFGVHDPDLANLHLGLVADAILYQILDGVLAGDIGVHRAVRDQPGGQVAVQIVRGLHAGIGELVPGLRLQLRIPYKLDHRRHMILDDDGADHLQGGVALGILHVVGHLIGVRFEDIHRVGHYDVSSQVPVHAILGGRAQIDILSASLHHDG